MLEIRLRFLKYFSQLSPLYFFLVVYVVKLNTDDKRHFLIYMFTRMFNFTTYDGTAINNEGRTEF